MCLASPERQPRIVNHQRETAVNWGKKPQNVMPSKFKVLWSVNKSFSGSRDTETRSLLLQL